MIDLPLSKSPTTFLSAIAHLKGSGITLASVKMRVAYTLSALSAFTGTAFAESLATPVPKQATAVSVSGENTAYATEVASEIEADYLAMAACSATCTVIVHETTSVIVSGITRKSSWSSFVDILPVLYQCSRPHGHGHGNSHAS